MKIANSITLSVKDGVTIDGIPFPFYVGPGGPEIEPGGAQALTVVHLPVLVDGFVSFDNGRHRWVIDSELGDVGEWARAMVRTGLLEAFPWLQLPAEAERLAWHGERV